MYSAVHAFMDHILKERFGLDPLFSSKIACIKKVNGAKQLHVMWCDGTGGNTIKGGGSLVLNPAWSPDGKKIALVSYYRNNPDLYIFDTVSFRLNLFSGLKGINISPAFDPTGNRLAFTQSGDGNPELYMISLDGTGRTRLTTSWATDTSPSFSPDGKGLVFCSSRAGNPQIFFLDLAGRKVTRLTYEGKYNTEPVFSPRGDLVAFSHLAKNGKYSIALIKPDGSRFRVLQGSGLSDEAPAFSPDGRLIAFAAADGNIYVMDLLGSAAVPITTGGGFSEPAWSTFMR
jgi:TolB protein